MTVSQHVALNHMMQVSQLHMSSAIKVGLAQKRHGLTNCLKWFLGSKATSAGLWYYTFGIK